MGYEVLGIGRGYLLAFLLVAGFIATMMVLILSGTAIGVAEKWVGMYTTFAVPILGVVVVPKELGKVFKKKE